MVAFRIENGEQEWIIRTVNGLLLDFGILKGQHLDHFCWLTTLTDLFFTLSVTDIANFVDANVLDFW